MTKEKVLIGNRAGYTRQYCAPALRRYAGRLLLALLVCASPARSARADVCSEPTFAAARPFTAGTNPGFVAVGDFNGDGKSDLAVANQVPVNNNGRWQITMSAAQSQGYFRLRKP